MGKHKMVWFYIVLHAHLATFMASHTHRSTPVVLLMPASTEWTSSSSSYCYSTGTDICKYFTWCLVHVNNGVSILSKRLVVWLIQLRCKVAMKNMVAFPRNVIWQNVSIVGVLCHYKYPRHMYLNGPNCNLFYAYPV